MRSLTLWIPTLALVLAACPAPVEPEPEDTIGDEETDTETESDTDTDTNGETDTDTDTNSETDTDTDDETDTETDTDDTDPKVDPCSLVGTGQTAVPDAKIFDLSQTDLWPNLSGSGSTILYTQAEYDTWKTQVGVDPGVVNFSTQAVVAMWSSVNSTCGLSVTTDEVFVDPNTGAPVVATEVYDSSGNCKVVCDALGAQLLVYAVDQLEDLTVCAEFTGACDP